MHSRIKGVPLTSSAVAHAPVRYPPASSLAKLLDQVREAVRLRHFSLCTEEVYVDWVRRFVLFHHRRHPAEMGGEEIRSFLSHLATQRHVAASTQTQALSALLFLYRYVLDRPEITVPDGVRAKRPRRFPSVFTPDEVRRIRAELHGTPRLVASLLYGSGLRLLKCMRLRGKDLQLSRLEITVCEGKGGKDRVTMLPVRLKEPVERHLRSVKLFHEHDLAAGYGAVYLPDALERKYPNAPHRWGWPYVFPAAGLSKDPRSGQLRRHHLSESAVQKAVKAAIRTAEIPSHGSCHTFRHSFATHLLEAGYNIRTVQV